MKLQRTIFSTELAGNRFKFAERTMREIESLVKEETSAYEELKANSTEPRAAIDRLKEIHFNFVLKAMNAVPDQTVTLDDLKDNMGAATFSSLYAAVLASQGIKLEPKNLGEDLAS